MINVMQVNNTLDVVKFIFYYILQACISFCTSHRGNIIFHLFTFIILILYYTIFSQMKRHLLQCKNYSPFFISAVQLKLYIIFTDVQKPHDSKF